MSFLSGLTTSVIKVGVVFQASAFIKNILGGNNDLIAKNGESLSWFCLEFLLKVEDQ
jgi:hypothetical protein